MDSVVAPPVAGVLVPAAAAVADSAPVASAALRTTKIALGTSPAGALSWRAERARNAAWLTFARTTGSAPDTLEIRLNPAGLAAGIYHDTVVVLTNNYSAAPVRLPVSFAVYPCRMTAVPFGTVVNTTLSPADCGSTRATGSFARVFTFPGTSGDSVSIAVTATGFNAELVLDTAAAGTAPPIARASACHGIAGDPCLPYVRLPRTTTYYVEVNGPAPAPGGTFALYLASPSPPQAPDQPRQLQADSVTAIATGAVVAAQPIVFRATLEDPDDVDSLRLELELRTVAAAFTGTPTHTSAPVANGALATLAVTVADDSAYHWRVRAADQTGRRGPWVAFGSNAETAADFLVHVPQPPAAPGALTQLHAVTGAPIVAGGITTVRSIVVRATLTDPDPGDQLRLEVEARPIGTAFTNAATAQSPPVASGASVEVTIAGLLDNSTHHWQARVVDQTGRASAWTAYGGNPETAADFAVAVPATQLAFAVQPATTTAGAPMAPAMRVVALTADGDTALSFADSVGLAMGTNPGGASISGTPRVKAVLGVATLADARFDRAGSGYTVVASSPGLPGVTATSAAFTVVAGGPALLEFTVQPSNATSGAAIAPAVRVAARDAGGNPVTSYTGTITMALGAHPPGASLTGGVSAAASGGVATFSNLILDKAGAGYTLVASASGLTAATSATFAVSPAAAARLEFSTVPGNGDTGLPLSPAVQVGAWDAQGNAATGFTGDVTVALAANPGGATLMGTVTRAAVAGVATFTDLTFDRPGAGYTLAATAAGVVPDTSTGITITAATAARLSFTVQPANTAAGAQLAVQLRVQDGFGNLVPSYTGPLTIAFGANPGGGSLSGTLSVPVVGGIANFANLSVTTAAAGYTLTASGPGVSDVTSEPFAITPAPPSTLAFTTQPTSLAAGATFAPVVAVSARDAFDNPATGFAGEITIALGTNPGSGALTGTAQVVAAGGVALFPGLSIDKVGTGYTLRATATGMAPATSAAFNVTPGAATQLVFTMQPRTTIAAAALPAVEVTARDAHGNTATGFTGAVTLAIGTNPGGGALSGLNPVAAVAGVATFSGLSIDKTGTGYTLTAAAATVSGATSTPFDITAGIATKLVFVVQPAGGAAGNLLTPPIQVAARDAQDNTVTAYTGTVTLALGANPGGGTLSGTLSMPFVSGVATFGTLSLDRTGAGYTLAAASAGLTGATSAAFTITSAPATRLVFSVQPSNVLAGAAITPSVRVTAQDSLGNTATTFTGLVTVALAANPSAGSLSGPTSVAAVAGIATFAGLRVDKVGNGYTLSAAAPATNTAVSTPFNVLPGPATHVTFEIHPATAVAGVPIAPAVQVLARDAGGNVAVGFTGALTVALVNAPGATLSGVATVSATAGVAAFPTLSVNRAGSGYALAASGSGLTPDTSAAFEVVAAAAAQLAFTVQPSRTGAGIAIAPAVQVTARDVFGNTATSFTGSVGLALASNPGSGTLTGGDPVAAVGGIATFSAVTIDKAAFGYQLAASGSGLAGGTSVVFEITAGPAAQLVFTEQPTGATAGVPMSPSIYVVARDAYGNLARQFTGAVTAGIANNPGGATLSGTTVRNAVDGVTIFNDLSLDRSGTDYRLSASSPGLTPGTSVGFNINHAAPARLAFAVQPSDQQAGVPVAPTVRVHVQDVFGNLAWSYVGALALTLTNPNGATLTGGGPIFTSGQGYADFPFLSVDKVGTYALQATSGALTGATSAAFTITPGVARSLVFTVHPPPSAVAGTALAPAIEVLALDGSGNEATGFTGNVTIAIGANPGGGTLSGAATVAAAAGRATFGTLSVNRTGSGYTLSASGTGLTTGVSAPFSITPAAAAQLAFSVPPTNAVAGAPFSPVVQVAARDAFGNTASDFGGSITVAIGANPGGGTLAGATTVAATAGIASFPDLSVNLVGTAYTLTAAAATLTAATSPPFNIVAASGSALTFTVQPADGTAGAALTPAVQVTARDPQGNVATGFSGDVTIAIGANPGGSILSGTATAAAVAGVATFANLRLDKAGSGYTLVANAAGLTGGASASFTITHGTASTLVFLGQPPASSVAGAMLAPPVQVQARDAFGNPATGYGGTVTVALGANPGGSTLSGTTSMTAVGGIATFATLSVNRVAVGYTLVAAAAGLTGATSTAFSITPAPASVLVFTVQPSDDTAGIAMTPAVQVTARDVHGNTATGFGGTVTITLGSNPGGGSLTGAPSAAAVAGVATFTNLRLNRPGAGYTFVASSAGLTSATSNAFSIVPGTASDLIFTMQPPNGTAGAALAPAVQVTARDPQGNVATAFTGLVTITIGANPGGSTLSGTPAVTAVAGVATFTNLRLNRPGSGYTLVANSPGVIAATSAVFNVVAGPASELVFTVQPPVSSVAGATLAPALQVLARDAQGNTATSYSGTVTLALGANPGGSTLSGTTSLPAAAGVATFSTLSVNRVGAGYTLVASAAGLTGATSTAFAITPGAANVLVFTVQPSDDTAGVAMTPAVQVTARDAHGNTATAFAGTVAIAIATNPGGSTLTGTLSAAAAAGIATFTNLRLDRPGAGYTLAASSAGLTGATSTPFTIVHAPASVLVITGQPPGSVVAGATLAPAVQVQARDALGNPATTYTGVITLAIGANPGGSVLSGMTPLAAVGGVATFSTLSLNRSGTGYTLVASAAGLTSATTAAFNVTPDVAARLAFSVQPSSTPAGSSVTPAIQVRAEDAFGNHVPSYTGAVSLVLAQNPGGGTLSGGGAVAAVGGIATFPAVSIERTGGGYQLAATAGGLATGTSAFFSITPGTPTQLVFTEQPIGGLAGAAMPAIHVVARDAFGNLATQFTGAVTVTLAVNPHAGTLSGTTVKTAAAGLAVFNDLSIERAGVGYQLGASATGLTSATSAPFGINFAPASRLEFVQQPSNASVGAPIAPTVRVRVTDAYGNLAWTYEGTITLALTAPNGAVLSGGTGTVGSGNGYADFPLLSVNQAGTYTLLAASGSLTTATSNAFTIAVAGP